MELRNYWNILRKRLWLVVPLMVVAVAVTVLLNLRQPPLYRTTTTLYLNPASPSALLPFYVTQSAESLANTYAEFMRTRSFAELVAQQVGDGTSSGEVLGAITTRYVPDTQFFKISTTHTNPVKAQRLANIAAQMLIAQNIARQREQQQQAQAQQNPVRALEQQRLQELQQSLQQKRDYYEEQVGRLQAQIAELQNRPPSGDVDQQILNLRQELIQNQTASVDVLTTLVQTQATLARSEEALAVDTAVVVDEAPLPASPLPRELPRQLIFALVASLGLGFGLAYLLEYLDYTVKTPAELDELYGAATFGVIGRIRSSDRRNGRHPKPVTITDPRSPVAEAFRALRTNVQLSSPDTPVRSLLVTSAGPAEGKTLVAANLAVSLAQGGSRVLLVDLDLRKPRQHHIFGVPKEPGFTNLVVDRWGDPEIYLRNTEEANLRVLACGITPPNPAELLGSDRVAQLMEQFKEHADVVIYDTPPAVTVTDAVVLSPRVDAVLQVVLAGKTRRDLVLHCRDSLERVNARVLGPVLNQVRVSDLGYYTYYYGNYYRDGDESRTRAPGDGMPASERGSLVRRRLRNIPPA